ncbi:MAG: hypothetical protein AABZ44_09865, partial [Elusimicrobiota bacterium]
MSNPIFSLAMIIFSAISAHAQFAAPMEDPSAAWARRINEMQLSLESIGDKGMVTPKDLDRLSPEDFENFKRAVDYINANKETCYANGIWTIDDACNAKRDEIDNILLKTQPIPDADGDKKATKEPAAKKEPFSKGAKPAQKDRSTYLDKTFERKGASGKAPALKLGANALGMPKGGDSKLKPTMNLPTGAKPVKEPRHKPEVNKSGEFTTTIRDVNTAHINSPISVKDIPLKSAGDVQSLRMDLGMIMSEEGNQPILAAALYGKTNDCNDAGKCRHVWLGVIPMHDQFTNKEIRFRRQHAQLTKGKSGSLDVQIALKAESGGMSDSERKLAAEKQEERSKIAAAHKEELDRVIGGIDLDSANAKTLGDLCRPTKKGFKKRSALLDFLDTGACDGIDDKESCDAAGAIIKDALRRLYDLP